MGTGFLYKVMPLVPVELMMDLKQAMSLAVSARTPVCCFSIDFQMISFNSLQMIELV